MDSSKHASIALSRAMAAFDLNRLATAEKELLIALRAEPNNVRALCLLSQVKLSDEKFAAARKLAKRAITADPSIATGYALLANAAASDPGFHPGLDRAPTDDTDEKSNTKIKYAYDVLKSAIQIEPENATYRALESQLLTELHSYEDAFRVAAIGLKHDPDNFDCLAAQALAYMKSGKPKRAIEICNKILADSPNAAAVFSYMSSAHVQLKDYRTALVFARQAVRLEPDNKQYRDKFSGCLQLAAPVFRPLRSIQQFIDRVTDRSYLIKTLIILAMTIVVSLIGYFSGQLLNVRLEYLAILLAPVFVVILFDEATGFLLQIWMLGNAEFRKLLSREEFWNLVFVGYAIAVGLLFVIAFTFQAEVVLAIGLGAIVLGMPVYCAVQSNHLVWKLIFACHLLVQIALYLITVKLFVELHPSDPQRYLAVWSLIALFVSAAMGSGCYSQFCRPSSSPEDE